MLLCYGKFYLMQYSQFPFMDIAINQIDLSVGLNALQDQVLARLEQVNVLEIQFLRQFECHHTSPETHASLVYSIRKILITFEDVYQGVKGYFVDLKMEITFELFRKIHLFMINGYNFLSRALLAHIDSSQERKTIQESVKNRQALILKHKQQKLSTQRSPSRKLEHCDYAIGFFQSEEAKITEQIHKVQESLLMSKQLVEKLIPSKAVKQLTEIKEQAELTLQNTQKIFEEAYQLKYLEFKNYLSQMLRPQEITTQFCQHVKTAMHDKFTNGVKRSVNTIQQIIKNEEQLLLRQIAVQTEDVQIVKTDKKQFVSKNTEKMQNLLLKERRTNQKLSYNLQLLKKEVQSLKNEKQRLVKELQSGRRELLETKENYDILTKLYEERRQELMRLQNSVGAQNKIINDLRIFQIKFKHKESREIQVNIPLEQSNKEVPLKLEDQQELIAIMRKRLEKLRSRILQLEQNDEKEAKTISARHTRKQSKSIIDQPEQKEMQVQRGSARKRTQVKKKTILGSILMTQRSGNENMALPKKISSLSGKMKFYRQLTTLEDNKKRHTQLGMSKFKNENTNKSLKSISEIEGISNNGQFKEAKDFGVQIALQDQVEVHCPSCPKQQAIKTDQSIQTQLFINTESQAKIMKQIKIRLSSQPKTSRQKSNRFKNTQELFQAATKEKRQSKLMVPPTKKQRHKVTQSDQNNLNQKQEQKYRNHLNEKHYFENLNISEDKNKTNKFILNGNNAKLNNSKDIRNLTCDYAPLENDQFQERKSCFQKQCLINIGRITLERSFDMEMVKDQAKTKKIYAEEQLNQ